MKIDAEVKAAVQVNLFEAGEGISGTELYSE